jgi:hypothetical protein
VAEVSVEYFNYSTTAGQSDAVDAATTDKIGVAKLPSFREAPALEGQPPAEHGSAVALRSKPITITPVRNPNGSISYSRPIATLAIRQG